MHRKHRTTQGTNKNKPWIIPKSRKIRTVPSDQWRRFTFNQPSPTAWRAKQRSHGAIQPHLVFLCYKFRGGRVTHCSHWTYLTTSYLLVPGEKSNLGLLWKADLLEKIRHLRQICAHLYVKSYGGKPEKLIWNRGITVVSLLNVRIEQYILYNRKMHFPMRNI